MRTFWARKVGAPAGAGAGRICGTTVMLYRLERVYPTVAKASHQARPVTAV